MPPRVSAQHQQLLPDSQCQMEHCPSSGSSEDVNWTNASGHGVAETDQLLVKQLNSCYVKSGSNAQEHPSNSQTAVCAMRGQNHGLQLDCLLCPVFVHPTE